MSLGSLVVTHPFHPLRGQRLEVLLERRCGGGPRVRVRRRRRAESRAGRGRDRSRPGAGRAAVELRGAGRAGGCGRRDRRREGEVSLLANQVQADDCFWVQRVECAPAAGAPAAPRGWIVGSRADVARGVVAQGSAVLERGVPLSAWRVARPVPVSGGVLGWAQPHDLRAGGGGGGRARRMSKARSATRSCCWRSRRSTWSC